MTIHERKAAFPGDLITQRVIGAGYDYAQIGPGQPASAIIDTAGFTTSSTARCDPPISEMLTPSTAWAPPSAVKPR